jgi:hypothetical protein
MNAKELRRIRERVFRLAEVEEAGGIREAEEYYDAREELHQAELAFAWGELARIASEDHSRLAARTIARDAIKVLEES